MTNVLRSKLLLSTNGPDDIDEGGHARDLCSVTTDSPALQQQMPAAVEKPQSRHRRDGQRGSDIAARLHRQLMKAYDSPCQQMVNTCDDIAPSRRSFTGACDECALDQRLCRNRCMMSPPKLASSRSPSHPFRRLLFLDHPPPQTYCRAQAARPASAPSRLRGRRSQQSQAAAALQPRSPVRALTAADPATSSSWS